MQPSLRIGAVLLVAMGQLAIADTFQMQLVGAAMGRTLQAVEYDGSYFAIDYPGGDVPADKGVCTDVLIRAYRQVGVDLQQAVHEDIRSNFQAYPSTRIWGLTRPDKNIDHRRVPNLQVFFSRHGEELPVTGASEDYQPGDLVTWRLPGNRPHIGIITDQKGQQGGRPLVVHNIGAGPKLEDILFRFTITGHYRYEP